MSEHPEIDLTPPVPGADVDVQDDGATEAPTGAAPVEAEED